MCWTEELCREVDGEDGFRSASPASCALKGWLSLVSLAVQRCPGTGESIAHCHWHHGSQSRDTLWWTAGQDLTLSKVRMKVQSPVSFSKITSLDKDSTNMPMTVGQPDPAQPPVSFLGG